MLFYISSLGIVIHHNLNHNHYINYYINHNMMCISSTCYNMCTQRSPYNWSEQLYQRHGDVSSSTLPYIYPTLPYLYSSYLPYLSYLDIFPSHWIHIFTPLVLLCNFISLQYPFLPSLPPSFMPFHLTNPFIYLHYNYSYTVYIYTYIYIPPLYPISHRPSQNT